MSFIIAKHYPNYEVNAHGKVRHIKHKRILKPYLRNGYPSVTCRKDGKGCYPKIHRLVAEAFLPNPLNLSDVNHINRDKTDNRVENLEWVTHQRNSEHALSKRYLLKSPDGLVVEIYNLNKFSRDNGLNQRNLNLVIKGHRKSCHGWRLP